MRIKTITDWKTARWKLISLVVSAKIQVWTVATLLLIFSLIGAGEWLTITIIVLGGRIARAYAEKTTTQETQETLEEDGEM